MSIKCIKGVFFALGMVLFSANVAAYPMLTFDGKLNYVAATGLLEINGALTGSSADVSAPLGSSFSVQGIFSGFGVDTNGFLTVGEFSGVAGNDLEIAGGSLLAGELSGLEMRGINGFASGVLNALFTPTAGSVQNLFSDPSDLFALTLNLTSVFDTAMFNSDFSGLVDGSLHSRALTVPEPGVVMLYFVGLFLLLGFYKRQVLASRVNRLK